MPSAPRLNAPPIVLLNAGGDLGWIVANGLAARLGHIVVIEEQPESNLQVIRRRTRLLGPIQAAGQIAFGLVQRLLGWRSEARLNAIWHQHGLDPSPDPAIETYKVPSVNSEECRDLLRRLNPAVVGVYGTRIIGVATLGTILAPFINYHAGINPKYRGQHPAYWARACGDDRNCGVTIHVVDRGVDTGAVLYQAMVEFEAEDTISTYQHVQAATAIPLFARALQDAIECRLNPRRVTMPSRLWYPPTLWTYLANGLKRGVW